MTKESSGLKVDTLVILIIGSVQKVLLTQLKNL